MKQWERRLGDLAHLLGACKQSYFEPETFRRNVNQFLTTARTVTFLIQKNKDSIPDFPRWYDANVIRAWGNDALMSWAKDSRNFIEKEGDLELFSTLRTTLIFSYLEEDDIVVECGREDLAHANVKRLIRHAQKALPTWQSDVAVVKLERRWVTKTMPDMELLNALTYIYEQHFRACRSLAAHLRTEFPHGSLKEAAGDGDGRQVRFYKVNGLSSNSLVTEAMPFDPNFKPPAGFANLTFQHQGRPTSLGDAMDAIAEIAVATFREYGHHVFMLFLFDRNWQVVDLMSPDFADQSDKFIFWRDAAVHAVNKQATAAVWVGESWVRQIDRQDLKPIRAMPIIGETLHVVGFDDSGAVEEIKWKIDRSADEDHPQLTLVVGEESIENVYFLIPVRRAMGVDSDVRITPRPFRSDD